MDSPFLAFQRRLVSGGQVQEASSGVWRLEIPAGSSQRYRLAQLDDYSALPRSKFRWQPPVELSLRARASHAEIPGTWGFGFWNDPFSFSLGIGGASRRLPALPNTAWFFFASAPNYLSLRDDLPAQGFLAATFRSPDLPGALLGVLSPLAVFAAIHPVGRLARKIARRFIAQSAALISTSLEAWHEYKVAWMTSQVRFFIDDSLVLQTSISPLGPLGLVLWIDNQYAALPPDGRLRSGVLSNPAPAWIELADLKVNRLPTNL